MRIAPFLRSHSFIFCLTLTLIALLVVTAVGGKSSWTKASPVRRDERPNIVVIMTDDQSHDTLTDQFMPNTKALVADQGINFTRGFMSTPLCCPSRASFLTGKYARNHGVRRNVDILEDTTVAARLKGAGYYTGMIGKYLNSWPGEARSEFDYWTCWKKGDTNPKMNIFGEDKIVPGHLTHLMRDFALDFLDKAPSDEPFFLLFAPHAPHAPAHPAPGDEDLYSDLPLWRPPNFNLAELPGKPSWLQGLKPLTPDEIADVDNFRLDQLRSLRSVDRAVRDIVNKLQEQGRLDNTLIVFFSDNGFFWGEQRLTGKNQVYEEASRGPFALRYPALVTTPRVEDRLIQVIDLAPTIYELAGIAIPADVDGKSLVGLMSGANQWRDAILLEGWPADSNDSNEAETASVRQTSNNLHYQAIRTEQYVYVQTDDDTSELYDLLADPFELHNLAKDRSYRGVVKKLRGRLKRGEF
jgi:arylsulfatase A-like enzyme